MVLISPMRWIQASWPFCKSGDFLTGHFPHPKIYLQTITMIWGIGQVIGQYLYYSQRRSDWGLRCVG